MAEDFEDAASLVDAVFGAARKEAEAADAAGGDEAADEPSAEAAAGEATAAGESAEVVAESPQDAGSKRKARKAKAGAAPAGADNPVAEPAKPSGEIAEAAAGPASADAPAAEPADSSGQLAQGAAAERKARKTEAGAAPAGADKPVAEPAEPSGDAAEAAAGPASADAPAAEPADSAGQLAQGAAAERKARKTKAAAAPTGAAAAEPAEPSTDLADVHASASEPSRKPVLTRGRMAAAAAVVLGVAAASVLVLSGGGSGNAATPGGTPSTLPSVNPQAFYPLQSAAPFATGGKSVLTDAGLLAAVPGCGGCKLVTRANGFSPDGAVLALFRTGAPQVGKANFKLVVVGADGRLVWSAPEGIKALTAGIERFSTDAAGNFYLALPGAKSGQVLVVLAWRDGKVQDLGGLLDPKVKSDSIVGVLPGGAGATATIVSQTTAGVPDADTGGLVESQYQIRDGKPVLVGCRRHVGESGQWIAFQPAADGCTHWPDGPVGPPDGDEDRTAPGQPPSSGATP